MKKIIAFAGSNSSTSINHQLLLAISGYVENAELEIISLRDYPAMVYSIDEEKTNGFPSTMQNLKDKFSEADGFIVSCPEHNSSMPAVFKNTIDWLSRMGRKVFNNKPVVFLSATPGGRGGASVQQHLLAIMPHQGANVIGGHGVGHFSENLVYGKLKEGEHSQKIKALIKELEEAL